MNRRRFLAISAACCAAPSVQASDAWRGFAFGAKASIRLRGPHVAIAEAKSRIPKRLREIESLFSLYDPQSQLSILNRRGVLSDPPALFWNLVHACDIAHSDTRGLFDPTVQVLWEALINDQPVAQAAAGLGWARIARDDKGIKLAPGQKLTFNGVAQGFATDLIVGDLADLGFTNDVLVSIGEFRAMGGPFRIGVADPVYGLLGYRTLSGRALATSSPDATRIGDKGHLFAPDGRHPRWSSVTVEAATATYADAISTAAVFMEHKEMRALSARADIRFLVVDTNGDVQTL